MEAADKRPSHAGIHSMGRSRNHGLLGGAMEVPNRRATPLAWPHVSVWRRSHGCHALRASARAASSSPSARPGTSSGMSEREHSSKAARSAMSSSVASALSMSEAHQSVV